MNTDEKKIEKKFKKNCGGKKYIMSRSASGFAVGVATWFNDNFYSKFWKGQEAHGGKIWRKNCIPHLREELVDAVTYLATVEDQYEKATMMLMAALQGKDEPNKDYEDWVLVQNALNVLLFGNADGTIEEEREERPTEDLSYKEIQYG